MVCVQCGEEWRMVLGGEEVDLVVPDGRSCPWCESDGEPVAECYQKVRTGRVIPLR